MKYWLVKTEPSAWSWEDQVKKQVTAWDGVRNYQAANSLKAMQTGDLCFFYHSVDERKIVGIVEVVRTWYPDPSDATGRFGMVDVKAFKDLDIPVHLNAIKAEPGLAHLSLVRQSRLSVMPVDEAAWKIILQMGEKR